MVARQSKHGNTTRSDYDKVEDSKRMARLVLGAYHGWARLEEQGEDMAERDGQRGCHTRRSEPKNTTLLWHVLHGRGKTKEPMSITS